MNDHIIIPLTQGYVTVISKEDEDLAAYKWHVSINTAFHKTFRPYARRNENVKAFPGMMHKIIMTRIAGAELPPYQIIDHKDNNPLNNTRENLRLATASQNSINRATNHNNKSGFRGVTPTKNGRFTASIGLNQKKYMLGTFDTAEEAYEAYCKAAKELHGEWARYE